MNKYDIISDPLSISFSLSLTTYNTAIMLTQKRLKHQFLMEMTYKNIILV